MIQGKKYINNEPFSNDDRSTNDNSTYTYN